MCINYTDPAALPAPRRIVGWKKVRHYDRVHPPRHYESGVLVGIRGTQPGFGSKGTQLTYVTGKVTIAPLGSPGVYVFLGKPPKRTYGTERVILVAVQKGTPIRRGRQNLRRALTADKVTVLRVLPQ